MCEICGRFPCAPRCHNAEEALVIDYCEHCGAKIENGYDYYTDNSFNKYCSFECAIEENGIRYCPCDE